MGSVGIAVTRSICAPQSSNANSTGTPTTSRSGASSSYPDPPGKQGSFAVAVNSPRPAPIRPSPFAIQGSPRGCPNRWHATAIRPKRLPANAPNPHSPIPNLIVNKRTNTRQQRNTHKNNFVNGSTNPKNDKSVDDRQENGIVNRSTNNFLAGILQKKHFVNNRSSRNVGDNARFQICLLKTRDHFVIIHAKYIDKR